MMKSKVLILLLSSLAIFGCGNGKDQNVIEESGTVEAENVLVSSERSGKIVDLFFEEGSNVTKGDTLLVIDPELILIKLKQAEANKKIASANLDLAKKGAREEDKKSASEQLKQAALNYKLSEKDYHRYKNLITDKVITQKQFDDMETRFEMSKANLNTAEQNYKKIKNIVRPEELQKSEAMFEQADAKVDEIKKMLKDSYITAPISGTVIKKYVDLGESINPMSSLLKVADLTKIDITIYIPETDLGKIKLGQAAEIVSDSFENKTYTGKVIFISPEAEFTPKNVQTKDERIKLVYAVKIKADNSSGELKSGMPVDVKIKLN